MSAPIAGYARFEPPSGPRPLQRLVCCAWNVKELWLVCVSLILMPITIISTNFYDEFTTDPHTWTSKDFGNGITVKVNIRSDVNWLTHVGYCKHALFIDNIDFKKFEVPEDRCETLCVADPLCNGFTSGAAYRAVGHVSNVTLQDDMCTLWFNGACSSVTTLAWVAGGNLTTHVSEVASRLTNPIEAVKVFLENSQDLLNRSWYTGASVIIIYIVAGAAFANVCLAVIISISAVACPAKYGTLLFFRQIVSLKKSNFSLAYFCIAFSACLLIESLALMMLIMGTLQQKFILLTPLILLLNVMDLRKVNHDMYPSSASMEPREVFLKIGWDRSAAKAEDLLEHVENGVIAYMCADCPRHLEEIVGDADIEAVLDCFRSFGDDNVDAIEGTWTGQSASVSSNILSLIFQLKPNLMVVYSAYILLTICATNVVVDLDLYLGAKVTGLSFKIFTYMFYGVLGFIPYPLIVKGARNPYPYGSLQFFVKWVQMKKEDAVFTNFAPQVGGFVLMGWLTVIPAYMWVAQGIDRQFYSQYFLNTVQPIVLCVINATQMRKVTENLYPEADDKPVFLKLNPKDIMLPAEDILERLENAFVAKKIARRQHDTHLRGVVLPDDDEAIAEMYRNFGKTRSAEEEKDQAMKRWQLLRQSLCGLSQTMLVCLLFAPFWYWSVHSSKIFQLTHDF